MDHALEQEVGDPDFYAALISTRPHLFSDASVFISHSQASEMLRIVRAIEAAARLTGYQDMALSWASDIARHDFGPRGVFMGYDFHITAAGPKLIEVNTNAGGAFLNALLAKAQRACCAEIEIAQSKVKPDDFDSAVLGMFHHEWLLQRTTGAPKRIAPRVHALFADKRNLVLLSDQEALRSWQLPAHMVVDLAGIPRTVQATSDNAQQLWGARKTLFFKPAGGHGGKAVYRGDKVTKRVWEEIIKGGYVAQEFAAPGERMIKLDSSVEARKADLRLFVYDEQILLTAGRLYQGQTTNFRTPGGGLRQSSSFR